MADDNVSSTTGTSEIDALDALWGDGSDVSSTAESTESNADAESGTDGSQSFGGDETEDDADADAEADKSGRKSTAGKSEDDDAGDAESDGDVEYPSVSFREVQKKYPKIFSEFPGLKQTLVREQKYTEVFSTVEHAEEARAKAETFDRFDQDIMSGSPDMILDGLHKNAKPVFEEFTGRFLDHVRSVDRQQYNRILQPVVADLIKSVYAHGIAEKNEDIQNSAQYFAKILFGKPVENVKVEKPYQEKKQGDDPERAKLTQERAEFNQRQFETALNTVNDLSCVKLEQDILKTIDPKDERSELTNKQLTTEVMTRLYDNLNKDARFMAQIKTLWQKAERAGYSKDWMNRISQTWTARARVVVKSIRQQVLNEATKKSSAPNKQTQNNTNRIPTGRAPQNVNGRGRVPNPRDIDWSKTTDDMLLNGRFTPKKR